MPAADVHLESHVLMISGVIDYSSVPPLMEKVKTFGKVRVETIDGAGLERIDSAGIAFLVWCKKQLCAETRPIQIRNAPEQLSRLLQVTGLGDLFARAD